MSSGWALYGLQTTPDGWHEGASLTMHPVLDSDWERVRDADWVVEASIGPLSNKREHLRALEAVGVKTVLSASTTATVAAQCRWLSGSMRVVGCDPLLMAVGAQVQTVVNASPADVAWLETVWPRRRFAMVADTVGLVFSREILPLMNEAADFVSRGMSVDDVNQGTRLGLNHPRGPFEWAELFGWPAVYWGLKALESSYGPRFRPHPWIGRQVGDSLLTQIDG